MFYVLCSMCSMEIAEAMSMCMCMCKTYEKAFLFSYVRLVN